jgi:hypothetical protein
MIYVIVRDDGMFVAPPGQEKSYTPNLQEAWTFSHKKTAQINRCEENEKVYEVGELLRPPQPNDWE